MPVRTWRRLHGTDLIAQVDPVAGFGTWTAQACVETDPLRSEVSPRQFELLTSAQATADHMVRERFNHRCDFAMCGEWLPWQEHELA